ncbi:amidohydrolase family protein [Conexibacter sp. S30A1]|uniref:amidohydrolase family protein n=1 Tax=Conexibacter sp. S30A1 TaxID=2937800 RepID=UPI00200F135F|nr:amidohydrolase family protein [Conexibacter sp. S30A1]
MAKRLLIKGGAVISVDPSIGELRVGDVLIEGDTIIDVARDIPAEDCEFLDATGMVVMPGLVDSHRHFWQTGTRADSIDHVFWDLVASQWPKIAAHYSPEDVYATVLAGAADALSAGVTTVLDWCHVVNTPEHAEENVRALRDIGIRSRFLYGASMSRKLNEFQGEADDTDSWAHARDLYTREFEGKEDGLLTYGLAIQGPDVSTMELTTTDCAAARDIGVPIAVHVGAPEGPPPMLSIQRMADANLLGPDINFAHCCNSTDEELRRLAEAGGTATACPTLDMAFGMGTPATGRLRDAGLRPAVGVDSVIASSGDMFEELRLGMLYERMRRSQAIFAKGTDVKSVAELGFTSREALESGTINSAHAMWLGDKVGSLTPGKKADVILLRATDLNLAPLSDMVGAVVCGANSGNVDTVLVNGKIVKRNGSLVGVDVARVHRLIVEARDRMYAYDAYPGMRPPLSTPTHLS